MGRLSRGFYVAFLAAASFDLSVGLAQGRQGEEPRVIATDGQQVLVVSTGRSRVVEAPWPVSRVVVAQPEIADVQVLSPTRIVVMGKAMGVTDLVLWREDEHAWQARVEVVLDFPFLKAELDRVFPRSSLELVPLKDVLVVSGSLSRAEHAVQLHAFLDAHELKYVDLTHVAGVQQVLLQVRVAEVSRRALRSLGMNAFYVDEDVFGGLTIGSSSGPINPISIGLLDGTPATDSLPFSFVGDVGVSSAVTVFAGFPHSDLEFFLEALAENQYLRILAEPNLVALSGEEANFLAGGEFPIPVLQGNISGVGTSVTIEWKEFGVRLKFKPLVLGDNTIRLSVAPEVSDLTDVGSVEVQGFQIPGVVTRRASTTLELKSGQTFAMAGLLSQTTNARSSRVPLLGDLPVLGPLFRSIRYVSGETELMVLVTASLVEPFSQANVPYPGITHVEPSDWELFCGGHLQGGADKLSAEQKSWLLESGLDRLKGPGAWAYHAPARPATPPTTPSSGDEAP
ncbi:MAG: type II and III secretion system protein family protein [Planctomycetota bacterium]